MSVRHPFKGQQIPERIRCLGMEYTVVIVDDEGMRAALDNPSSGVPWGLTDYSTKRIYLLADQSDERLWLTFAHECAHVLLDAAGMVMQDSEPMAERLERPIASMLAENDWQ